MVILIMNTVPSAKGHAYEERKFCFTLCNIVNTSFNFAVIQTSC